MLDFFGIVSLLRSSRALVLLTKYTDGGEKFLWLVAK